MAEERAHAREQARVLRVPLVPHGTVGRPRVDRVHGRQVHRRRARPQRLAAEPLLPDARRPRDHGERGRCRADRPGEREGQGAPRARSHVPHRFRARPARTGRRDQERLREPSSIRRMARGESHRVATGRRRERVAGGRSGDADAAPASVRLHDRDAALHAAPDGARASRSRRLDGQRQHARRAQRQAANALRLFPAVVRASDQPADRLDPRRSHHVARVLRRARRQSARNHAEACRTAALAPADPHRTKSWLASRT